MNILKNAVKKTLLSLGYKIYRSNTEIKLQYELQVNFNNFVNLAKAYERRLNDSSNIVLPKNELRLKLLSRVLGTPPSEAYFIVEALIKCKNISGDICEFGVAQGETSALIANEIKQSSYKILHLFDSFEGLPRPSEKDKLKDDIFSLGSMEKYAGTMSCPEDMVRTRLQAISFPLERCVIHKGFIEQLIHKDKCLPTEVSFAYVDFDFYEPTKIALKFLHRVTPIGAIIIVDDYNFFSSGVKTAVDEFIKEMNSNELGYECFVPDIEYGYFVILTKKGIGKRIS